MAVAFDTKVDTSELDARIQDAYPEANLEEGLRFARWMTFPELKDDAFVARVKARLLPLGEYRGTVIGKPLTAFFFLDRFPDA